MIGHRGILSRPAIAYDPVTEVPQNDAFPWLRKKSLSQQAQPQSGHPILDRSSCYGDFGLFASKFSSSASQMQLAYRNPYGPQILWADASLYPLPQSPMELSLGIDEDLQNPSSKTGPRSQSPIAHLAVPSPPQLELSCQRSFESIEISKQLDDVSSIYSVDSRPEDLCVTEIMHAWADEEFAQGNDLAHVACKQLCDAYLHQTRNVDLSGFGLHSMPPIVFLTQAQQIDLSKNNITEAELPLELCNLRVLDLRNNAINTFPRLRQQQRRTFVLLDPDVQETKQNRKHHLKRLWQPFKNFWTGTLPDRNYPLRGKR